MYQLLEHLPEIGSGLYLASEAIGASKSLKANTVIGLIVDIVKLFLAKKKK